MFIIYISIFPNAGPGGVSNFKCNPIQVYIILGGQEKYGLFPLLELFCVQFSSVHND